MRGIAYNTRFLILPWVTVPHLASHVLGRMATIVPQDWQRIYGHPIYLFETFIDPQRFRGTCYRAANWIVLGRTTGRGKNAPSKRPTRSIKEVLGLSGKEIHVHRVALHACHSCGHLIPTRAGQAKVDRLVTRGIQLFLGLLP